MERVSWCLLKSWAILIMARHTSLLLSHLYITHVVTELSERRCRLLRAIDSNCRKLVGALEDNCGPSTGKIPKSRLHYKNLAYSSFYWSCHLIWCNRSYFDFFILNKMLDFLSLPNLILRCNARWVSRQSYQFKNLSSAKFHSQVSHDRLHHQHTGWSRWVINTSPPLAAPNAAGTVMPYCGPISCWRFAALKKRR